MDFKEYYNKHKNKNEINPMSTCVIGLLKPFYNITKTDIKLQLVNLDEIFYLIEKWHKEKIKLYLESEINDD